VDWKDNFLFRAFPSSSLLHFVYCIHDYTARRLSVRTGVLVNSQVRHTSSSYIVISMQWGRYNEIVKHFSNFNLFYSDWLKKLIEVDNSGARQGRREAHDDLSNSRFAVPDVNYTIFVCVFCYIMLVVPMMDRFTSQEIGLSYLPIGTRGWIKKYSGEGYLC